MQRQATVTFIFINGKPGAGKDTMAKRIVANTPNATMISTGAIYRGAKSGIGEFAKYKPQIDPYVDTVDNHGGLIPDEIIFPIVKDVLAQKTGLGITNFVFNGFPRTVEQLKLTDDMIAKLRDQLGDTYDLDARFICLAVLDNHSETRIGKRYLGDLKSGTDPRIEDSPKGVRERLQVYKEPGKTQDMLRILSQERRLIVIKSSGEIEDNIRRLTKELEEGRSTNRELPHPANKETEG